MKIVYLVHQFFPEFHSGTENFVLNMSRMTQKIGNRVKVITYSNFDDAEYDTEIEGVLSKDYIYNGVPVLSVKLRNPPTDLTSGLNINALKEFSRRILTHEVPDILHVAHSMRIHPFLWAAIDLKIPYVVTLTDFFVICPKVILAPTRDSLCNGPKQGAACGEFCREFGADYIKDRLAKAEIILRGAKRIITPSKFVSNIFKNELPGLNTLTVGHGIRLKEFNPREQLYSDSGENLVFGFAGTLANHKGLHVLVKAFKEIQYKNIELRIYGAGEPDYIKMLEQEVSGDQRIKFCGAYSLDQVGEVFAGIDVMVIPSICYETYAFVLHEALACNVPAIVSDLGGLSEKISNGVNGYTFHPGDAGDLREKMEFIIENPSVLNQLRSNISLDILVPSIEGEAYSYFKLYNEINKEAHPAPLSAS